MISISTTRTGKVFKQTQIDSGDPTKRAVIAPFSKKRIRKREDVNIPYETSTPLTADHVTDRKALEIQDIFDELDLDKSYKQIKPTIEPITSSIREQATIFDSLDNVDLSIYDVVEEGKSVIL